MQSPYPTLTVNLDAISRNWNLLRGELKSGRCAAVVKANAYGLGMSKVAPVLYKAGCRDFFVATLAEGMELRTQLNDAAIYVFHGVRAGENQTFASHNLIPVLNSRAQIGLWNDTAPWVLHVDTGMCRLGVTPEEAAEISKQAKSKLCLVMSHLACAGDPAQPKNKEQLVLFRAVLTHFPGIPASLANSSGISLGSEYHFDLARPGRAIYGITRGSTFPKGMEHVATLSAPVLQYRTLTKNETVGYGATVTAKKGSVLATVEIGYADGLKRSLAGKIHGYAGNIRVPVLGIISMDMVIVDLTSVPAAQRTPDLRITFISKEQTVDDVADLIHTIGYEIFTGLGTRVRRIYTP